MRLVMLLLALAAGGCASRGMPPPTPPPETVWDARPPPDNGAIFQAHQGFRLFEDRRARAVGDVHTVLLVERTDARKSATTATSKDTSVGISAPNVFGRPVTVGGTDVLGVELGSGQSFSGSGNSAQSNALSGSLSVLVTEVLPNGTLVVRGEKRLALNQGSELVAIEGLVRPADIGPDNTVRSDRIANSRIRYGGSGVLADANQMGWFARFFNSGWWPF
jgi:flagellar L-ring protein precursor FlgH